MRSGINAEDANLYYVHKCLRRTVVDIHICVYIVLLKTTLKSMFIYFRFASTQTIGAIATTRIIALSKNTTSGAINHRTIPNQCYAKNPNVQLSTIYYVYVYYSIQSKSCVGASSSKRSTRVYRAHAFRRTYLDKVNFK